MKIEAVGKFFSPKGYGFAEGSKGEQVHITRRVLVESGVGDQFLPGTRMTIDAEKKEKGLSATHVVAHV